ncbi:hypothetical protein NQ318_002787 [Aromia moschata]|uniref:Uncharacterized protein n=1 Tax=Aromia moschata TaxID=1265417 RepID=A0AAV8XTJ0_9CUCU|nr:hypothetical protein NQ318_002787 [Aromia moschata]
MSRGCDNLCPLTHLIIFLPIRCIAGAYISPSRETVISIAIQNKLYYRHCSISTFVLFESYFDRSESAAFLFDFFMSSLLKGDCMIRDFIQIHDYPAQNTLESIAQGVNCPLCSRNMSAVPQGAFAAKKVRKNEEKLKEYNFNMEMNPTKYSSKFMNSVWGQYNRYSVHNLKKIMESGVVSMSSSKDKGLAATVQAEKNSLSSDVGSPITFSSNNLRNSVYFDNKIRRLSPTYGHLEDC